MIVVTAERGVPEPGILEATGFSAAMWNGDEGVVPTFQRIYKDTIPSIIGYIHNDVSIHEQGWETRIEAEFADPKVAIVGMGGASGIGLPEIYKRPYEIWQLQRIDYYSNQTDWQVHGKRETGARDVAVVDGFFMAVRRSFLDEIGGWSWMGTRYHCYDLALCLMAHRRGWKVRMVGVHCTHHGGGTSTSAEYKAWLESQGTNQADDHSVPHRWLYDSFRDVLPWRVK